MHNQDELSAYEQNLLKAVYSGMSRYVTSGFSDMDRKAKMMHLTELVTATSAAGVLYHQTILDNLKVISQREVMEIDGNQGYKGLARLEDGKMHGVFLGKNYLDRQIQYEENYIAYEGGANLVGKAAKHLDWFRKYYEDALSKTQDEPEFLIEISQMFIYANEDLQEVIGVAMSEV